MIFLRGLLFLILSLTLSQAETISLESGAIIFQVPDNFTPLTVNEIQAKYPSIRAPRLVVGNANRTVTVAYDTKPSGVPPEKMVDSELPEAQKAFAHTFSRVVPGIRWIKNEIITLNGKKFIYLELTSNAIDQDIHNIILITFFREKIFLVNFNSTKTEFNTMGPILKKCANSVVVKN